MFSKQVIKMFYVEEVWNQTFMYICFLISKLFCFAMQVWCLLFLENLTNKLCDIIILQIHIKSHLLSRVLQHRYFYTPIITYAMFVS